MNDTIHDLPLASIKTRERMRKEMGDIHGLADSISRHGLFEPIIIDRDNFLIAGERRLRAHQFLKLETIKCIYRDQAPLDVQAEIEFEENFFRKNMSWQEEALGVLNIYRKKRQAAMEQGWSESYQQVVSRMFQMSVGNVNYILAVAKKLENEKDPKGRWHSFSCAAEAYRLGILADEEDKVSKVNAQLVKAKANIAATKQQKQEQAAAIKVIEEVAAAEATPDALAYERERYEKNPANTKPFDVYWTERQNEAKRLEDEHKNTIYISSRFHFGDCIEYMMDKDNKELFHHIVTDPPYAIDLENMNQETQAKMVDIDKLVEQHQVIKNLDLLKKFFPAAWHCTHDRAFVVLCCDVMQWDYLYKIATEVGFAVQRWPYIWRKVNQSVANNSAQYNTTKDFEPVMICRKPSTTLSNKRNTSFTDASNVKVTKETGHPFAKPYELTRDLIEMISLPNQKILDPFMGGGAMFIQGLRMNRSMFGCEMEEDWFNKAVGNVKELYYKPINPRYIFK